MSVPLHASIARVRIPSPTNSQRMERAPITGVMIKGSKVIKITGPRRLRVKLLTASASAKPSAKTSGRVIKVKVSVKRSARQKSMSISCAQSSALTSVQNFRGSTTSA